MENVSMMGSGEFIFHDGSITAEGEYDNICEKYKHRIQRFRETVQEGKVCFVRAIIDQAEVCWIKENSEYILKIINKFPESEIVFLAHQGLGEMKNFPFRLYMLNIYGWMTDTRYQLRSAFDTNENLFLIVRQIIRSRNCWKIRNLMKKRSSICRKGEPDFS